MVSIEGSVHLRNELKKMTVLIIAIYTQHSVNDEAFRIAGNKYHTLSLIPVRAIWVTQTHDNEYLAAIITRTGGPPFTAIENELLALLFDAERYVRTV